MTILHPEANLSAVIRRKNAEVFFIEISDEIIVEKTATARMNNSTKKILIYTRSRILQGLAQQASSLLSETKLAVSAHLNAEKFFDNALESPNSIILVDWEMGYKNCINLLTRLSPYKLPHGFVIILIAPKIEAAMARACSEYAVDGIVNDKSTVTELVETLKTQLLTGKNRASSSAFLAKYGELKRSGQDAEALRLLYDEQMKNPKNEIIAAELCNFLIESDRVSDARVILEKYVDTGSTSIRILNLLGRVYLREGRLKLAKNALGKARLFNPYNTERLVDFGNTCLQLDEIADAGEAYQEALLMDPNCIGAKRGLGACKLAVGELNEGLQLIQSCSSNRELASTFNIVAIITIRRGQLDPALRLYNMALGALENDPFCMARIYFNIAIAYARTGHQRQAGLYLEKSLEQDPQYLKPRERLKAFVRKGYDCQMKNSLQLLKTVFTDTAGEESLSASANLDLDSMFEQIN